MIISCYSTNYLTHKKTAGLFKNLTRGGREKFNSFKAAKQYLYAYKTIKYFKHDIVNYSF